MVSRKFEVEGAHNNRFEKDARSARASQAGRSIPAPAFSFRKENQYIFLGRQNEL